MQNKAPKFSCVLRVARMVEGFSGYLTVSCIIRAISKFSVMFLAYRAALLILRAVDESLVNIGGDVALVLLMLTGIVLSAYLDTYVSHDMSFRILDQLRHKVYDRVDEIAPGGLEGRDVADLSTMLLNDINVFEWFYAHCLVEWIGTFIALAAVLALLSTYSLWSGCVLIPVFIFMMALPLLSLKQAEEKGLVSKKLNGRLISTIADGIWGIKDVIGFHWTKSFYKNLEKTSRDLADAQMHYATRSEKERTLLAIAAGIGIVVSVLSACFFSNVHSAELIIIFALSTAAVNCVHDTLSEGTNFGFVFGAAYRIVDVLDIPVPVHDTGKRKMIHIPEAGCTVTFWNVGFAYDGRSENPVLKNITFEACPGEITAIVAASGAGKSTIARLLQRFWDIDHGNIYLNDYDIRDLTLESLRDVVNVVPQDIYLFNGTIAENIRMVKTDATDEEIQQAAARAQADGYIEKLERGYGTPIGENGLMLSGGEKQRLALTQAFLKNAPVLVLDEATSALDTENEWKINREIRMMGAKRTTIVIAHRLSSMISADKIVFIKNGCVHQVGSYDCLIHENADFRELVRGEYLEQDKM